MKKQLLYLSALLLISISAIQAQEFTLTGEVNARSEFRNGFKRPILEDQDPAFFTEQRSRLYFNYKEEKFETQITLQDIRFWGAAGQVYKADQSMTSLAEGWGKYKFSPTTSIKVGRQIISYDNQRFFGGLEWAMQGRRHDAFVFAYEKDGFKLHAGGAFNQNPANGAEPVRLVETDYTGIGVSPYHATGNYKHMEYVWANKKFENGSMSAYVVNDARQEVDRVYARQTYGLMASAKLGAVKLNGEYFYQGGEVSGGTELSASLMSLSATMKAGETPITLGYDYLSGDDESTTDKNESFAPAFGTNHAFYGFMDYFYVGNGHKGGLQDIFLKTKLKVGKGALLVHGHYFMSAADIAYEGGTADTQLGTEIDLVYVKKLSPGVTWKLGYSHMLESDGMLAAKSIDSTADLGTNFWGWTQIIFKPTFFKSEK